MTYIFLNNFRKLLTKSPIVDNLHEIFTMMALNVVWQMAAGERFNFDENGMVNLLNIQQSINETLWSLQMGPLSSMPSLRYFPPWKGIIKEANCKMENLRNFFRQTIQKHRDEFVKVIKHFHMNFVIALMHILGNFYRV